MGTFTKVAKTNQIPVGAALGVTVSGCKIALFHVGDAYYAIGNNCTHRGGPLCEGELEGTTVTCPWHGGTFDVTTGRNLSAPAPSPVTCYSIRVQGDDIEVDV